MSPSPSRLRLLRATEETSTGTVTFLHPGATVLGTGALEQRQRRHIHDIGATGTSHTITATYAGDGNYNASTSPGTAKSKRPLQPPPLASSINPSSLGSPLRSQLPLLPAFGGAATGTVTFHHGYRPGNWNLLRQRRQILLTGLGIGTSHIDATYGGNGEYLTSTSSALAQVVDKASTTTTIASSLNPSK